MASYNQFNYNYRPAKSVERKIFIDLLRQIYGIKGIQECEYIGFGSIYFTDFRLIHRELGINKMTNIESNVEDKERFKFNTPFSCVKLEWGMSHDVLPRLDWAGKKILWLDYDSQLQQYMFDDIDHIFSNIEPGSFYLMSCNSLLSKFFDSNTQAFKVEEFKEAFTGLYPFNLDMQMLQNKNSPTLIRTMVINRINHNLKMLNAARNKKDKLRFIQLLSIVYKDGAPMTSIGGILLMEKDISKFKKNGTFKLPFIKTDQEQELNIETPKLTTQEIDLLNNYLPSPKSKFIKRKKIQFIPDEEKEKYIRAYRYFPSFVEIRDL